MEVTIPYYQDNSRISNSSLGWFMESPRYYKDRLDGKIEGEKTKAMDNGTMIHLNLLQQSEFWKEYEILDFETPSSAQQKKFAEDYVATDATEHDLKAVAAFSNNYSIKGKSEDKIVAEALEMASKLESYIKYLEVGNTKTVISWSDHNKVKTIEENVKRHKKANELLYGYEPSETIEVHNEFHINWEFPVNGITSYTIQMACKSLLDRVVIDHEAKKILLVDIKTTSSIKDFSQSVEKYDYYRQMCYYWMALCWYFKHELKKDIEEYTQETYIVAIQTNNGYPVKVFKLNDDRITSKIELITQIISDIAYHTVACSWDFSREYYEGDGVEYLKDAA